MTVTGDVLASHVEAFRVGDLEAMLDDYAEDAVAAQPFAAKTAPKRCPLMPTQARNYRPNTDAGPLQGARPNRHAASGRGFTE